MITSEPQVLSVLLYTYPLFSTSHTILATLVDSMCNSHPEKLTLAQERTNVVLSKWLELQYNWEIERDKALFRSIEKVIKGKIAPDNRTGADELETELHKVHAVSGLSHPAGFVIEKQPRGQRKQQNVGDSVCISFLI